MFVELLNILFCVISSPCNCEIYLFFRFVGVGVFKFKYLIYIFIFFHFLQSSVQTTEQTEHILWWPELGVHWQWPGPGTCPCQGEAWAERVKLENWHVRCTGVQGFTGSHTLTLIRSTWRHPGKWHQWHRSHHGQWHQWPGDNQGVRVSILMSPGGSDPALWVHGWQAWASDPHTPSPHLWCGLIWEVQGCVQHGHGPPHALIHPWNK